LTILVRLYGSNDGKGKAEQIHLYTFEMFPVSDVIPSKTRPFVTVGLIAVNVVVFCYELQLSRPELQSVADTYGVVPAHFAPATLVTSLFLHEGWLHLLGNMLYLWIFGDNVEDRLGHAWYGFFYLACGVASAMGHVAGDAGSTTPMIGASGAIAGVMGAYFVLYPHSRVLTVIFLVFFLDIIEVPAIFFLAIWFVKELFNGVGSLAAHANEDVAVWAHVVGFSVGAATGMLWRLRHVSGQQYWDKV
jgi:membrane associated rhomboid family serine protease